MTIELRADMTGFFRERLVAALERQRVRASDATEFYLVNLLTRYGRQPGAQGLGRPLVQRLADALEAPSDHERFRCFREMGEHALYVCGFCSDHLRRRGVSRGYVVSMGGRAYFAAGDLARDAFDEVYPELASRFDTFAHVLDEVRESTALRTPQDIVRLYERWRRTRSPTLASRLEEEGVYPMDGDGTLH